MTTAAKQEEYIIDTGCNFLETRSVYATNEEEHTKPKEPTHYCLKFQAK
jgi:hypothetical protein